MTVGHGEIVGVIGPNGAGKTTLFNVICGFVRPTQGRILLGGRELRRHRPHHLARLGVARTLQATGLVPGLTVIENVMAAVTLRSAAATATAFAGIGPSPSLEKRRRALALEALDRLGVAALADRLPASLPHGTAKRVALARALASSPRLLLLDEPASGLTDAERSDLSDLLHRLHQDMAVVLVEHHMDLVMATCHRIVVLDFGRVIANGAPDEVRNDPVVTEAYLGRELTAVAAPTGVGPLPEPGATDAPG